MPQQRMHNDEPATTDSLDREKYVRAFVEIAKTCQTPAVIGLYGQWGVGKTSLMKQIQQGPIHNALPV